MRYLEVSGARLAYDVRGRGPTIVLLHDAGSDQGEWRAQVAALRTRYRMVSVDLRGHGASSDSAEAPTVQTLTDDLEALLDAVRARSACLVGHGLGGIVAQQPALRRPERVRALVLIGTLPAPAEEMAGVVQAPAAGDTDSTALQTLHSAALVALGSPQSSRHVAEIGCSVLVVAGEDDGPVYQQGAELLHGWIPNSRLVRIAEAGHAPHWQAPAILNAHLLAFLAEC